MELKAKTGYASVYGTLQPGDTTERLDFPEKEKARMLETFPDWFEVVPGTEAPKQKKDEVETSESRVKIKTK